MAKKQLLELNQLDRLDEALVRFVNRIGEARLGSFGISMPGSAAVRLLDVQFDFAAYRDRSLKPYFKSGVWIIERQENRDWHVHAAVDTGFDIQTGFPFDEVKKRNYSHVPHNVRKLWKSLRDETDEPDFFTSTNAPARDGVVGRLIDYNRPYLMPIRPGTAERFISYLSGRAINPAYQKHFKKPPPEGCGSWGWEGAIKL